jgi:hypothetical protein
MRSRISGSTSPISLAAKKRQVKSFSVCKFVKYGPCNRNRLNEARLNEARLNQIDTPDCNTHIATLMETKRK